MKDEILERFVRYAKIETTSDLHQDVTPSTECQWDLLNLLVEELKELGITDITLNEHGYLIARLESNFSKLKPGAPEPPVIGFMAHVDTSSDVSGKNVNPIIHDNYDGKPINLKSEVIIDPQSDPDLGKYTGHTVITADGTTLLGADDKAGLAEIMTAVKYFLDNPETPHGTVEIIFTPDEETGKGMDRFPVKELKSVFCYTLDGGEEGHIEVECFNAFMAKLKFKGRVIHLGSARGTLVNAVTMASTFISMLPRNESPEATDERYGYYCPFEIKGELEEAEVVVYIRDFDLSEAERRVETVKTLAGAVEAVFPGGEVEVTAKKQYLNMKEHMDKVPRGLEFLLDSVREAGVEPEYEIIRGGTDGARLAEMGIPTPNVFTGGHNFHSRKEWAVLSTMEKSCLTIINIIRKWADTDGTAS